MRSGILLPLLLGAACRFAAVAPTPLAGPVPTTIAIWPAVAADHVAAADALLAGLGDAVAGRGYRVVTAAIARQLLRDAGLWQPDMPAPPDLAAPGRVLFADAVLELDVRAFADEDDGQRRYAAARWDLAWRLRSTAGGVLWQHEHRGAWQRPREDGGEPPARDGRIEPVLFGGDRPPVFADRRALLAGLHHLALLHLPPR
jgi:hypothetical protein